MVDGWEGAGRLDGSGVEDALRKKGGPEERIEQLSLEVQQISYVRRGPLPAPSEFEGYENVLVGAADRILTMTEKGLDAQIGSVEGAVEDAHISRRAEAFAFKVTATAVAGLPWLLVLLTGVLVFAGHDVAATVSAIGAAVAVGPQLINSVRGRSIEKTEQ